MSLLLLPACKTHRQLVTVNTEPQGALLRTDLGDEGRTPYVVIVEKKKDFTVSLSLEGYEDVSFVLSPELDGSTRVRDIVSTGIIPAISEGVLGAHHRHEPVILVRMKKVQ